MNEGIIKAGEEGRGVTDVGGGADVDVLSMLTSPPAVGATTQRVTSLLAILTLLF